MAPFAFAQHLQRNFRVTWPECVRPAPGAAVTPMQGYRAERYHNRQTGLSVPALVAAADQSQLMDLFLALLEPLGSMVDVFLESSHAVGSSNARCMRRESIDAPVLSSILYDFEDVLLNDGCSAITVACTRSSVEVQLDEHKHLIVYAWERKTFGQIMKSFGLGRRDDLVLLFEVPHIHHTTPEYAERFGELADALDTSETRQITIG